MLHPIMDRDSPSLFGQDVRRSWRTYTGVLLFAALNAIELSSP